MDTRTITTDIAEIITQGAAMLDDVATVVHECRTQPDPSSDLAKACGSLQSRYLALRRRLATLPGAAFNRHLDELLNYQLEITAQASMLAFRPHDSHWAALAAGFGDGLGTPTDQLRQLAEDVRLRMAVPDDGVNASDVTTSARRTF